jgi:hypothetical protein
MAGRINFSVLLIVSCFLSFYPKSGELFGSSQPDKRSVAIQRFNEGHFDTAVPLLSELCYNFPYDFLIKYYYGACLVETGNFGLDAEKNLVLASSGEVPVKVYYYLGRLYHGRGDWNNGQRFYNRFRNNAEAPEIAALKVDDLIQLCYTEVNPFISEKPDSLMNLRIADVSVSKDSAKTTFIMQNSDSAVIDVNSGHIVESGLVKEAAKDSVSRDTSQILNTVQAEPVNPVEEKEILVAEGSDNQNVQEKPDLVKFFDFQINDKVTYLVEDMFHVTEAKYEFRNAVNKEILLDSLMKSVQMLRKQYHLNVNPLIRDSLAVRIQNLEYQNMVLNTEVDRHYFKSRELEQEWWKMAAYSSLEEYSSRKDSLIKIRNAQNLPEIVKVKENIPDSVDVNVLIDSTSVASVVKPDSEIVYKIQIGAYNKGIPAQRKLQFERLEKIRTIESLSLEDGVTVYTTGNLKNYDDALKSQAQIRLEGIKDAFVIAVRNGKKVILPKENSLK